MFLFSSEERLKERSRKISAVFLVHNQKASARTRLVRGHIVKKKNPQKFNQRVLNQCENQQAARVTISNQAWRVLSWTAAFWMNSRRFIVFTWKKSITKVWHTIYKSLHLHLSALFWVWNSQSLEMCINMLLKNIHFSSLVPSTAHILRHYAVFFSFYILCGTRATQTFRNSRIYCCILLDFSPTTVSKWLFWRSGEIEFSSSLGWNDCTDGRMWSMILILFFVTGFLNSDAA